MSSSATVAQDPTKHPDFQPLKVIRQIDPAELRKLLEVRYAKDGRAYRPPHLTVAKHSSAAPSIIAKSASADKPQPDTDIEAKKIVPFILPWQYPWCTIGKIIATDTSGDQTQGVGIVVARDLLLCAGHTVPWNGGSMQFIPAWNAGDEPLGSAWCTEAHGYNVPVPSANDLAICKLATQLGTTTTGWVGALAFPNDSGYVDLSPDAINLVGYNFGVSNNYLTEIGYPVDFSQDFGDFIELIFADQFTWGNSFTDAVCWIDYGGDPHCIAVMSGTVTNPDQGLQGLQVWAPGLGLYDLEGWGLQNFG